jgi:glycosyltransferase involved in cell wall biosynthesis
MTSIVIPAYNEGQVIERCLAAILADTRPGEFEIVVACNGCKDDTAARARRFAGVKVLETDVASKIHALNMGDRAATRFPRFFVDADIELTAEAIRDVAELLGDDSEILVAAPRAVVDYADRKPWIRSFYRVWTQLPYFTQGIIGAGVYALSRRGRQRFDEFPDIIADDQFARLIAAPHERTTSAQSTFTITPPTTVRGVVEIFTRARAGNYQFRQRFPELLVNETTSASRSLGILARRVDLWPHAPIYLTVMFVAKLRAHRKLSKRLHRVWERDETGRSAFANTRRS